MEFNQILNTRKSIRSFTGEPVSEKVLTQILTAANAAPVGLGKYESVHLTVIQNQALLSKISENASTVLHADNRDLLYHAPQLIVVSTTGQDNVSHSNAAIIVHNMTLQAVECGVGSCCIWGCIMALNQNPDLLKELHLPEGFTPSCALAIGYSDESYTLREFAPNRIATDYIK